ncbi:hypothetical protein JHK86_039177 [Glycine max]|nr:hypothetical protein JHK86_039177 [Glycine max]
MDRSWMNESRISPEYEEGVEQFLQFASQRGQPDEDGKYYCPCINCLNGRRQILDDIREHLLPHNCHLMSSEKKLTMFMLIVMITMKEN